MPLAGVRIAFVVDHFWPTITDAAFQRLAFCRMLRDAGAQVSVLTEKPASNWADRVNVDGIQVIRLARSGTFRKSPLERVFLKWIQENAESVDLLFFDFNDVSKDSSFALRIEGSASGPPAIVRFDPDPLQQEGSFRPSRSLVKNLKSASLVVTSRADTHQPLIAADIAVERIVRCPDQNTILDRSIGARRLARQVLRETNPELGLRSNDFLLLCPSSMNAKIGHETWGIQQLVDAVGPLTERNESLRVWILGDGPVREKLQERIRNHSWHYSISMPGIFTETSELLQSADGCIFPSAGVGRTFFMPLCLASRIPFLAESSPALSSLCPKRTNRLNWKAETSVSIRGRIAEWIEHWDESEKVAMQSQNEYLDQVEKTQGEEFLIQRLVEIVRN